MSHLSHFNYATASDEARAEHDREVSLRGRMTNMKRTLLHAPVAHRIYAEWFTLREELRPALDDRAVWLFCQAISIECRSIIPVGFFRRALINAGLTPETVEPTADEALLIAFGTAMVADSNAVPDDLWARLKARYDEPTLVNLVAFAGIMIATAIFNNVIKIDVDPELGPFLEGYTLPPR
ncbi:carboxymuconolactone decarboxylase family protein [Rhizobium sp. HT1-10]|uniref:carboxymuconolactone decarboxylase family protein n=1 Tax=Rhizobium sp. HT1-10 TaxID=3111638 RepID=UPI003C280648